MSLGLGKLTNDYARLVDSTIPASKAVWIAIAVSLANRIDGTGVIERGGAPIDALMAEWQALYDNGIVPQKPRKDRL